MDKDSYPDTGWDQATFWQSEVAQVAVDGWASTPLTEFDSGRSAATRESDPQEDTSPTGAAYLAGTGGPPWPPNDRSPGVGHDPTSAAKGRTTGVAARITVGLGAVLAASAIVAILRASTAGQAAVGAPAPFGALPVAPVTDQSSADPGVGPAPNPSDSPAASDPASPTPSAARPAPKPSIRRTPTAAAVAPTPGPRTFEFVSRVSGEPFGVANGSTADGAGIVEFSRRGSAAARWFLLDVGSGFVAIINANSGKALDDTDGSTANGNPLQQWDFVAGDTNQQWQFVSLGEFEMIVNRSSGLVIDLRDGQSGPGTVIQQWEGSAEDPNQHWTVVLD